jgi:L-lactate dehydrogenase (cytochrome)
MQIKYNATLSGIDDLIKKAKRKIPRFAFEYLDGGCNEDVNLFKNTADLREVELKPYYLSKHISSDMKTELFGHIYDAPFGIARLACRDSCGQTHLKYLPGLHLNIMFLLS